MVTIVTVVTMVHVPIRPTYSHLLSRSAPRMATALFLLVASLMLWRRHRLLKKCAHGPHRRLQIVLLACLASAGRRQVALGWTRSSLRCALIAVERATMALAPALAPAL